jgi:hypothetical protein
MYHWELYTAKWGNDSYTWKVLGSPTVKLDKCIFGVLFTTAFLTLLVGPLWFFSEAGGFIAPNPVKEADVTFAFVISKNLTNEAFNNTLNVQDLNSTVTPSQDGGSSLTQKVPYIIFENENPFFRQYDKAYFD